MIGPFYLSPEGKRAIRQAQAEVRRKLMVARSRRVVVEQQARVVLVIGREVVR